MSPTRWSWVYCVDRARAVGGAVATLVGREHVVPGVTQRLQLVAPRVPALGEAVAEHDRGPVVRARLRRRACECRWCRRAGGGSCRAPCSARSRSAVGSWVRSAPRNAAVSGSARCTSDSSWRRTAQARGPAVEHVATGAAVVGEEVQVVAGDLHARTRRAATRSRPWCRRHAASSNSDCCSVATASGTPGAVRHSGADVDAHRSGRRRAPRRTRWRSGAAGRWRR